MDRKQLDQFLADSSMTIMEAMQKIDSNSKGILFILSDDEKLIGTITDGDIRRAIIRTGDLHVRIADIMNPDPKVVAQKDRQTAHSLLRKFQLRAIAVVDKDRRLVDVVFDLDTDLSSEKKDSLKGVPVVIMAGGKGTRLYPFTKILPKPLIPIGDVPILERIMDRFCGYGADEFCISVNYRKNMIKSYLAEKQDYRVLFIEEEQPLGTAGSLKLLAGRIQKPFFVTNCDILIRADYGKVYEHHVRSGNMATIISALKNIELPYGVVESNGGGNVSAIREKPKMSYFINTGMYVLDQQCLEWIPEGPVFHMTDLVEKLLREGRGIGMYPVSEDSFLDMGEWEELQRMEHKLRQSSG
ncbi:MAG: NTP transferase domain-containing protein [Eubacterium sp.]|nr:NTP transferase domain-containing protein [Eubacterium sp.]